MEKVSSKGGVQQLADSFLKHGIQHIVFSPGSRNAPLVITFAKDERFESFVIPDERSAAFFALGMSEQLRKPVAVMCTSGSALLNYYPAVSEAFYRNIPLVVVSADRPEAWIDQGDGQTIRQIGALKNHVLQEVNLLEAPSTDEELWYNRRVLDEVLNKVTSDPAGPVHINFPLSEPLYQTVKADKRFESERNIEIVQPETRLSDKQVEELREIWNASPKKLVLCGQLPKNDYLNEQLRRVADNKSVAVVVENTSNLQDRSFVHCIDRTITSFIEDDPELYQPDLLITIGGAVISKKIKAYLRKYKPKHHWRIGKEFVFMDTYQSLTKSIPVDVNDFFNLVLNEGFEGEISRYGEQWKQLDYLTKYNHQDYLEQAPYSDLKVFDFILDTVPDSSVLHLANSSVIRYAQLFDPIRGVTYFCNRGTSGIDGSTSTAVGNVVAAGEGKVHTLITGDISFFYDSNGLWNRYLPTNLRIFLINNGGGGIFDIIPGPKSTGSGDEFFVAKHEYQAKALCEAYDLNYFAAKSMEDLDKQIDEFYDVLPNDRPAVMEIFTDSKFSGEILADYFKTTKVGSIPKLEM